MNTVAHACSHIGSGRQGLRLRRVTWNSYALSPNLGVLGGEERRQLHRLHAGRTGLAESVAFILLEW